MNSRLLFSLLLLSLSTVSAQVVIDQQASATGNGVSYPVGSSAPLAQVVTAGRLGTLTRVDLSFGAPLVTGSGQTRVRIVPLGSAARPALPISGVVASATAPFQFGGTTSFDLTASGYSVQPGDRFAIIIDTTNTLFTYVQGGSSSGYSGGAFLESSTDPFSGAQSWNGSGGLNFTTWVDEAPPPLTAPVVETFDALTVGTPGCSTATSGTLPQSWTTGDTTGQGAWTTFSGATPTAGTGPSDDFTGGGNYLYVEGSGGCATGTFTLLSPMVDLSALSNPVLIFRVHRNGDQLGTLLVEETDGAGGWREIVRADGRFGDGWFFGEFPLTQTMTQVRFTVSGATGESSDVAIDQVGFVAGLGIGSLFPAPIGAEFQANSPNSTMTTSTSTLAVGNLAQIEWSSALVGSLHDLVVNFGLPVGLSAGGYQTPGLQTVNVPLDFRTLTFLNQSTFGSLVPHPGTVRTNLFGGSPFQASAQQYVLDPGSADGVTFSAAIGVDVVRATVGPISVSLGDDATTEVVFATLPLHSNLSIPFMGTSYTGVFINSNGTLGFGGGSNTFRSTPTAAAQESGRFGLWTDLNPAAGGQITYTVDRDGIAVDYAGVPYFGNGQVAGPNHVLRIETSGVATIDLSGMQPNPNPSTFLGAPMWLGISGGGSVGATDAGATTFAAGGTGGNALATDMIYAYASRTDLTSTVVPGQLDSITNLLTGSGTLTFTPGSTPGFYTWTGL